MSTPKTKVYKVSAVSNAIKKVVEANPYLQDIIVLGEISNLKPNRSGHFYFSIKDEDAVIDAVMYKWQCQRLEFQPENGMKVFIKGNVSYYEKSGRIQLLAQKMALDGMGNLHQKFEELKKNLDKEGLFRKEHKKPIPEYPKKIGVVTSQTGAAVRDIITTIRRRYPIAKIKLYPVVVQGDKAAPSIVNAIRFFNDKEPVDTLIVGRGGGSIEDLWAFNEEIVARAIFSSSIPIISAVGHETDTTISDFVADTRAATPTGAAELATPHPVYELSSQLKKNDEKMISIVERKLKQNKELKARLHKNLMFRHPERKLGEMIQTKDRALEQLINSMKHKVERNRNDFSTISLRLQNKNPSSKAKDLRNHNEHLKSLLILKLKAKLTEQRNELQKRILQLDGLSPLKIMSRGYSLTFKNEEIVKSTTQLKLTDNVTVKLADGDFEATITNIGRGK